MQKMPNIVIKLLATLLLAAAILKARQLLTEPVANNSFWTYRSILILQVEIELTLAIWFFSGLLKKTAWIAAILLFSLFSAITTYKALTGAKSCGCFGQIHVNPWITLFAIDLPALAALAAWRPSFSFRRIPTSIKSLFIELLTPKPSLLNLAAVASFALLAAAITTPLLALNKPPATTTSYELLEPETWLGQKLPIIREISIGKKFLKGYWLVLLYHHDCPDCLRAIQHYEKTAPNTAKNANFLRVAFVEVPPYGPTGLGHNSACLIGRLADSKQWFITTPAVILLKNGKVKSAWQGQAPSFDTVIERISALNAQTTP